MGCSVALRLHPNTLLCCKNLLSIGLGAGYVPQIVQYTTFFVGVCRWWTHCSDCCCGVLHALQLHMQPAEFGAKRGERDGAATSHVHALALAPLVVAGVAVSVWQRGALPLCDQPHAAAPTSVQCSRCGRSPVSCGGRLCCLPSWRQPKLAACQVYLALRLCQAQVECLSMWLWDPPELSLAGLLACWRQCVAAVLMQLGGCCTLRVSVGRKSPQVVAWERGEDMHAYVCT